MPKLNRIFLDHNATTPMLPAVKEAMFDLYQHPLNASSVHANGRAAKHYLELARQRVRAMIGADDSYHVIFTSSGTESNNLALTIRNSAKIVSVLEHSSILSVAKEALIPATRDGMIDLEALEALLSSGHYSNPLISVMLANNETGVIQPIEEVKNLARKYKCLLHTDATQAPGKIAIDINWIDMMTISAHKFGGPIGVAALICKKDLDLQPLVVGGGQEYRIRSGTHNIQAIHGLGIACELEPQYRKKMQLIKILRYNLEQQIQIIARNAIIFGAKSPRLPNTTSIGMLSVTAEAQLIHFDMNEIAVSAGSACSSGTAKPPHVHMAMGYDYNTAKSAIRVSLGINSTQIEIDKFIASWQNLYARAYDNNVMKKVI